MTWDLEWNHIPGISEFLQSFPHQKFVIWDMDGTLVDSERHHAVAISKTLNKLLGINISGEEILKKFIGKPDDMVFEELATQNGKEISFRDFMKEKNEFLKQIYQAPNQVGVDFFRKEILNLLSGLQKSHRTLALVTASENYFMHSILDLLPESFFSLRVGRQDTALSKPHAMPYLYAMEKLGAKNPKEEVVILEDSPTGLMAATSSGASVVKVSWFSF
ncbi:MAG: HAD family phosphatase [Bacteriovoracaceae bacterium]|nr:HAD family phosphatase [Bacteriovoracaceae bacterium]